MYALTTIYHMSKQQSDLAYAVRHKSVYSDRLRWIGHVLRSEDLVLREVLQFVPVRGACGRPRCRFVDTLKMDLAERNGVVASRTQAQFWDELSMLAADRIEWRSAVVNWGR